MSSQLDIFQHQGCSRRRRRVKIAFHGNGTKVKGYRRGYKDPIERRHLNDGIHIGFDIPMKPIALAITVRRMRSIVSLLCYVAAFCCQSSIAINVTIVFSLVLASCRQRKQFMQRRQPSSLAMTVHCRRDQLSYVRTFKGLKRRVFGSQHHSDCQRHAHEANISTLKVPGISLSIIT